MPMTEYVEGTRLPYQNQPRVPRITAVAATPATRRQSVRRGRSDSCGLCPSDGRVLCERCPPGRVGRDPEHDERVETVQRSETADAEGDQAEHDLDDDRQEGEAGPLDGTGEL